MESLFFFAFDCMYAFFGQFVRKIPNCLLNLKFRSVEFDGDFWFFVC